MSEENQEQTYEVIYEPTGRAWTMRPLPKHIFLMFGQMPTSLSEIAIKAMQEGDEAAFQKELQSTLSPEEMMQSAMFAREAVKYSVVSPKISLTPRVGEVSAFDVTEDEFNFLVKTAIQSIGGSAEGLKSFRSQPAKASGNSANSTKSRKKPK